MNKRWNRRVGQAMAFTLAWSWALSVNALDMTDRTLFGLIELEQSHPHLRGNGFAGGVADTEFDVLHPGLGFSGTADYVTWRTSQDPYPDLSRENQRVFASANRNLNNWGQVQLHGSSFSGFLLPIANNNTLQNNIWRDHGTAVAGTMASGIQGAGNSIGAAPEARLVLASDTATLHYPISLIDEGNEVRMVVANRSFTGSSMVQSKVRRNTGVITVNAAGNSFSTSSNSQLNDRLQVYGVSPHSSSLRWNDPDAYDIVVGGLRVLNANEAYMSSGGSQRNQETILTDYAVRSIRPGGITDTYTAGTSHASPLMAGGIILVQQAHALAHDGHWLRTDQMARILRKSGRFVDDQFTGLRLPVANFAAAVGVAEAYEGDPSLEPNFTADFLPEPSLNDYDAEADRFADPLKFRTDFYYGYGFHEFNAPVIENGAMVYRGGSPYGGANVAVRNGWGDVSVVDLSEPGKQLRMSLHYESSSQNQPTEFLMGIKEMVGSAQFMDENQLRDGRNVGRLAVKVSRQPGAAYLDVELLRVGDIPNMFSAIWSRSQFPEFEQTPLADAHVPYIHGGTPLTIEVTSDRFRLLSNAGTVFDVAHGVYTAVLERSTPYFHFENADDSQEQRISAFEVSTETTRPPHVRLEPTRTRALIGKGHGAGAGRGVLTVRRDHADDHPLTVHYHASVTGNLEPTDLVEPLSGSITIPAHRVTADMELIPLDDAPVSSATVEITLVDDAAYDIAHQGGWYGVSIVEPSERVWNAIHETMAVSGSFNNEDAGAGNMRLIGDNKWQAELDFSGSTDVTLSFYADNQSGQRWGDNNPAGALPHISGIATQGGAPIQLPGELEGRFRVTYYDGSKHYAIEALDMQDDNLAPVADAGPDRETLQMEPVTLDGSNSYDPDGTIASYAWTVENSAVSGPVQLAAADTPSPTVSWGAPTVDNRMAVIRLTVTDNQGVTGFDTVEVTQRAEMDFDRNFAQVYFRGTANAWGGTAMTLSSNHTWQLDVAFTGDGNDRFKFDLYADWSHNYGDNNQNGYLDYSGDDIYVSEGAGTYRIWINDDTFQYGVTKLQVNELPVAVPGEDQTIGLSGGPLNLDGSGSYDPDGTIEAYAWSQEAGPTAGIADAASAIATVTIPERNAAATYRFRLDVTDNEGGSASAIIEVEQDEGLYDRVYDQVYFRGTPNAWGAGGMALVSNHLWEIALSVEAGDEERFKFDIHGDWSLDFGDSDGDGYADQTGDDIYFTEGAGDYTIRFNDETKAYWVIKEGGGGYLRNYNQVFFRGTPNGWTTSGMALISNFTWYIEVTAGAGSSERFKFDVHGDWSFNFGDNGANGYVDQDGDDIFFTKGSGTYRIWFNDQSGQYNVHKQGEGYQHKYEAMSVAGSFNSWNPAANNMQLVDDYLWRYDLVLFPGSQIQFKFTANSSWGLNWGDYAQPGTTVPINGTGDADAPNIVLEAQESGAYRITYNGQTKAYSITVLSSTADIKVADVGITAWEQRYGLNLLADGVAGANPDDDSLTNLEESHVGTNPFEADTDGDGMPDPNELIAGTDALNGADYLHVTSTAGDGTEGWTVSWSAVANRRYEVQGAPSIGGPWDALAVVEVNPSSGNTEWVDWNISEDFDAGYRYYRVQVTREDHGEIQPVTVRD